MALIDWNDSYSVGVAAIDEQHKTFVAMLNELDDARNKRIEHDVLEGTLVNLVEYAATHFRTEEQYFAELGYPDTENHKKEHAAFLMKCATFLEEFEKGKAALTTDVTHFLRDWFKDHIARVDRQYVRFFEEKGLK